MKHLRESFARLRRAVAWRAAVVGGACVLEVTLNDKTGLWHAHLHILAHGAYLPHEKLSAMWFRASQGSPVVLIKAVKQKEGCAAYLAKYLAKDVLTGDDALPEHKQDEYYKALKGARLLQAFGDISADDWDDPDAPTDDGPDDWVDMGSEADILTRAKAGDPAAIAIVNSILTPKKEYEVICPESAPP